MSRHASWQLDGSRAKLGSGFLAAHLDLANPAAGLAQFQWADVALAPHANLLCVGVAPAGQAPPNQAPVNPLIDAYLRGPDLIATYGPTASHPFRSQVYWREQTDRYPGAALAVELVVSIQTELLDSRPRLAISSLLSAASGSHWRSADHAGDDCEDLACPPPAPRQFDSTGGIGCFRFQLAGSSWVYCEMVHPSDFHSSSLAAHGMPRSETPGSKAATRLTHQLFSGQLEKGVILRSRVLGLFLPAGAPGAMIVECYRSFVAEQLPLTT